MLTRLTFEVDQQLPKVLTKVFQGTRNSFKSVLCCVCQRDSHHAHTRRVTSIAYKVKLYEVSEKHVFHQFVTETDMGSIVKIDQGVPKYIGLKTNIPRDQLIDFHSNDTSANKRNWKYSSTSPETRSYKNSAPSHIPLCCPWITCQFHDFQVDQLCLQ